MSFDQMTFHSMYELYCACACVYFIDMLPRSAYQNANKLNIDTLHNLMSFLSKSVRLWREKGHNDPFPFLRKENCFVYCCLSCCFNSRVHISEKTLQCLDGEFEVEPAFGEKREETLRIAGLKTYFIKKVLVPVS